MDNKIAVKGSAKRSFKPDIVKISMSIIEYNDDIVDVKDNLNERIKILYDDLEEIGINKKNIKTKVYSIDENIKYENQQKIMYGYIGTHLSELKFEYNPKKLMDILEAISDSKSNTTFNTSFELSNIQEKEKVMQREAYDNAYSNAINLANASNTKIIELNEINYLNSPTPYLMSSKNNDNTLYLYPTDIVLEVNLTAVYKISKNINTRYY